ncbi:MAG: hypothetical protein ACO3T4_04000 [Candidatus Nanopelagicales bacterium]|jgi:hypothetical protein
MNEKMRPEDKIVDGLMALGQIAMGLNEFVTEKVNEKLKPCSCGKTNSAAEIRQIVQEEIRAFMGKHNFVTEEELAALRKVVNQMKSTKKTKPKG